MLTRRGNASFAVSLTLLAIVLTAPALAGGQSSTGVVASNTPSDTSLQHAIDLFQRDQKVAERLHAWNADGYSLAGNPGAVLTSKTCRILEPGNCIKDYFVFQDLVRKDSMYVTRISIVADVFVAGFPVERPEGVTLLPFDAPSDGGSRWDSVKPTWRWYPGDSGCGPLSLPLGGMAFDGWNEGHGAGDGWSSDGQTYTLAYTFTWIAATPSPPASETIGMIATVTSVTQQGIPLRLCLIT
jgi:hypothetical protein